MISRSKRKPYSRLLHYVKNNYFIEFDNVWHVVLLLQFVLVTQQSIHAVTAATNSVLVFLLQHGAH